MAIPIDSQFSVSSADLTLANEKFRFWRAEQLLDQAADLFDRGIRTRTEWDEYRVRDFETSLKVREESAFAEIVAQQIASGLLDLQSREATAEAQLQRVILNGEATATNILVELQAMYPGLTRRRSLLSQMQAYVTAMPDNGALYPFRAQDGNPGPSYTEGVPTPKPEWLRAVALDLIALDHEIDNRTLLAQLADRTRTTSAEATAKIEAMEARSAFEIANVDRLRRRVEIEASSAAARLLSLDSEDGELHYKGRMEPLKKHFDRDFRDGLNRAFVASIGLDRLFGFSRPLPRQLIPVIDGTSPASRQVFDDWLDYVRDAISFLTQFAQSDQNAVTSVNLRSLMSDADYAAALNSGEFAFDVNELQVFPDMRHVRLRGVSIVAETEQRSGIWTGELSGPRESFCRHLDGKKVDLDQVELPGCRFGRISSRESVRDPDIMGTSALHNVSPIGRWRLKLNAKSSTGIDRSAIKEVSVDLFVAFRSLH